MEKLQLTQEKETLLVPLYSRALASRQPHPIIHDPKAEEILDRLDYDFGALQIPRQTLVTSAMRAKKLDEYVSEYLEQTDHPVVVNLGCGLDSRVVRVGDDRGQWYDLDYPEVTDLRKHFYTESDDYHMISSSVTDFGWLDQVEEGGDAFVVAEGLLMYLRGEEVRQLVAELQGKFASCRFAFDAFSTLTARNVGRHPSIKKTGAQVHWGIDDPTEMESWGPGIKLLEEWYFTQSEDISKTGFWYGLVFRLAGLFAVAKKAHRILLFEL